MSTYTSLTYHVIFSTKYRKPRIVESVREDLYSYIGGIIRGEKGSLLEIGGVEDHIHLLTGFRPTTTVSDMLKLIKGKSSKWINEERKTKSRFGWQAGYGAFTVFQSQIPIVRRYIQGQVEHHKTLSVPQVETWGYSPASRRDAFSPDGKLIAVSPTTGQGALL